MNNENVSINPLKNQKHSSCTCTNCHTDLNASLGDRMPKHGDISVCAYCGAINKFVENSDGISFEEFSTTDLEDLRENYPEGYMQIRAYQEIIKTRNNER